MKKISSKNNSDLFEKIKAWFAKVTFHVPFTQKMMFAYHLQTMTEAGLPIVNALKVLSEELDNKKMRTAVGAIKLEVEKGKQLSEALTLFPKIFPPVYISMIAAGESAGQLEESLRQISTQMKKTHQLTSTIRGAMIYPLIIVIAMVGIGLEMVIFVLPKIIGMFNDFKAELPLATRILVAVVNFMQSYGIFAIAGFIGLVVLIVYLIHRPEIKKRVHKFNLHLPIFGGVIKQINLARFSITLSSLLQSTVPIIEAVKITAQVQGNVTYRDALLTVSEDLKKGETLSETLARHRLVFPPMVTEMIMVGEESGKIEHMLAEIADYYSNEVDGTMKNFSAIIEPVIILILGLAVAGVAVAVIMPMYSLAQQF
ncbi:MAG: hypothetical protein A3J93_05300 [Candidatus Magasanikbacteria bacterium RIFOXYC2_FULL_42_28]|uniref:Type II secretion system protein GspF domain-containing protein n=1 Tax=Candidatus Magasanikbacteria bacterium RIFOXYC2_FULL_42_28 TaxID=1798704 RepID=A0A1F6NV63_9BACT|nr:MAG: hypothetical protein A3J93_05300 [Candidatus Magasanikbacteria bacterium RIFOXYC2_FULL_42_28]